MEHKGDYMGEGGGPLEGLVKQGCSKPTLNLKVLKGTFLY